MAENLAVFSFPTVLYEEELDWLRTWFKERIKLGIFECIPKNSRNHITRKIKFRRKVSSKRGLFWWKTSTIGGKRVEQNIQWNSYEISKSFDNILHK